EHIIEVLPGVLSKPAPAFLNGPGRHEGLKEPLRTSFAADECAVGFCKGARGQNEFGFLRRRSREVIEYDQMSGGFEQGIDVSARRATVEIIFQNDERIGLSLPDRLKCGA